MAALNARLVEAGDSIVERLELWVTWGSVYYPEFNDADTPALEAWRLAKGDQ